MSMNKEEQDQFIKDHRDTWVLVNYQSLDEIEKMAVFYSLLKKWFAEKNPILDEVEDMVMKIKNRKKDS